ncbi:MAG: hypothetical protein ABIT38_01805, partial [Gemmatimonadaceae bacterium]
MPLLRVVSWLAVGLCAACARDGGGGEGSNGGGSASGGSAGGAAVLAGTRIGAPAPPNAEGQWTMPAGDYANSRYSGLNQITSANAAGLHASWT